MINFKFEKLDSVDSTNDYITREVDSGILTKDKILVTKHQTDGHGSKGRKFISTKDVGIYFTLLHFYDDEKELKYITQKVAVAVYKTFYEVFGIELSIKWINDLYYKDKKVCGILCRNLIKHKAVIIGVGIDLFKNDSIDDEIKDIAGYIFKDKEELVETIKNGTRYPKDSCTVRNIIEDFKSLKIEGIVINDSCLWEPDQITIEIAMRIYELMKVEGLPKLYIEKNIVKDKKIYEDCDLEC